MSKLSQTQCLGSERTSTSGPSLPDPHTCQLMRALAAVLLDIARNPCRERCEPASPSERGAAQRRVR
jgi:hypothetical protein